GEEIFGNPANPVAHAAGPAHADHVLRDGHAGAASGDLNQLAELHVFDDVHAQAAVASAFFVGVAAHQLECAHSHIAARARIRSLPRLVAEDEAEAEVGNRGDLPEAAH